MNLKDYIKNINSFLINENSANTSQEVSYVAEAVAKTGGKRSSTRKTAPKVNSAPAAVSETPVTTVEPASAPAVTTEPAPVVNTPSLDQQIEPAKDTSNEQAAASVLPTEQFNNLVTEFETFLNALSTDGIKLEEIINAISERNAATGAAQQNSQGTTTIQ